MNPSSNETAGIQLPPPMAETAPAGGETATGAEQTGRPAAAEALSAANMTPAAPPAAIPLPTMPTVPKKGAKSDDSTTTSPGSLQIADDGDLIEKEWVSKAKAIVDKTSQDPYKQSEELTGFKADYMQKRYNKTLKTNK